MKITKAVIPAAGFGTRFLPQTKAMPKEMLPIVDKPVIQYVVEEAVEAGVQDIIIVTGSNKRAIEDHFDAPDEDLLKNLQEGKKEDRITEVKKISELANFVYVRQKGPYGNATPIKCAEHVVENEPFLVLWGDDFVVAKPSRAQQLIDAYDKYQATILCGIKTDDPEDANRYGFVEGEEVEKGIWKVRRLIEKPGPGKAPSNLAIVSGYVLTPDIFPILNSQKPGKGGEYYLPEAIDLLAQHKPVYAVEIQNGKYYDTGNKLAYLKTVVEMALQHPNINGEFKKFLKKLPL
ncbi:UTP--glucose-1-phosphate uridylyltransferase [Candidatus Roizmanbacteria bacterium RIFCSPLOWO2_12_FULL_40_12]|uniref:UTP--glucose-1-phosphate uridylyltransferase n=1 Tax=Candidatus Roizmanbacteria bacterium RIFCSPLOWO2_01_FULL_40_42 TaxID=1802066 RepID=A0A1F7J5J1_9BACT|nr:MAG: UTP--glucose-1-phosphate uridylyltransferase [Candidatus Roizmanbacteria bacterium RIFCSPHIGHO2_01_FULL_40_98]OGK28325.1 MAG: UTP--glucose-1-phosphate uridylyltransferase [Candidatus Roizmanbacteria bacterium RIFCSPHIGHO2_02_FULL_40_53]OGK36975.1 MAG: UTP--glucose-1-phosphate uridylyltransferase [Candidatus Roizmanbacteria bacterium RIFCSPHIGHO2_12_FULL_40_130]OGK50881.1 MAG: UTP--glucose-1-phosphate uridylyltransferase [Candidatus Roizmanbacteria bacterium RIFCSPLOWO2_01_FULL_40_42]OGK